ncbi:MAG: ABC transporter ATP-binding protein, partial [Bacteroidales bacterium]|nr:ABC transporter ATP-binding protein [Bacteroidales bacterium]
MKDFIQVLKRYVTPYKKYLGGSILLNILSVIFNLFSFAFIVPILNILFKLDNKVYEFIPWDTEGMAFLDKA